MTGPDAVPAEDAAEQHLSAAGDAARAPEPGQRLEAAEADLAEQAQPVDDEQHAAERDLPLEADGADAAEQAVVVPIDDDVDRA